MKLDSTKPWKGIQEEFSEESLDIIDYEQKDITQTFCPNLQPNGNCRRRDNLDKDETAYILDSSKKCPYSNDPVECEEYERIQIRAFARDNWDKFFS